MGRKRSVRDWKRVHERNRLRRLKRKSPPTIKRFGKKEYYSSYPGKRELRLMKQREYYYKFTKLKDTARRARVYEIEE